jgi:hypothetical protein
MLVLRAVPLVVKVIDVVVEKLVVLEAVKAATLPEPRVKNVAPVPPKTLIPRLNVTNPAVTDILRAVALPVTV